MVSESKLNREILFRGKRKDNGNWIEGSLFARINSCYIIPLPIITSKSEVIPETVGQVTGLTDKNGTKVFEGDIIRVNTDGQNILGWVSFERSGFHFRFGKHGTALITEWAKPMEVIGNIHDNPELLEGNHG